jgi:cell wall-associated NlpC family hydrolase
MVPPNLDQRPTRVLAALVAACALLLAGAHAAPADPIDSALAPILAVPAPQQITSLSFPLAGQPSFVVPAADAEALAARFQAVQRTYRTTWLTALMVAAGNKIADFPYIWGGGHGSFISPGYDCSGSVSFVLRAAGLLSVPEDSSQLESYGLPGPGRHVTIYTNAEHAWMTIDGRRFDTIAYQETGTRWSDTMMPTAGYVVVHPPGF